jgi:hypothetical protein
MKITGGRSQYPSLTVSHVKSQLIHHPLKAQATNDPTLFLIITNPSFSNRENALDTPV